MRSEPSDSQQRAQQTQPGDLQQSQSEKQGADAGDDQRDEIPFGVLLDSPHQEAVYHGAGYVSAVEAKAGNGIDQSESNAENHIVPQQQRKGIGPCGTDLLIAGHKGRNAHRAQHITWLAHIHHRWQCLVVQTLPLKHQNPRCVLQHGPQTVSLGTRACSAIAARVLQRAPHGQAHVLRYLSRRIHSGVLDVLEAADIGIALVTALQPALRIVMGYVDALVIKPYEVGANAVAQALLLRLLQATQPAVLVADGAVVQLSDHVLHLQPAIAPQRRFGRQLCDYHVLVVLVEGRHDYAQRRDEQIADAGEHKVVPNAGTKDAQLAKPAQAVQVIMRELRVGQRQAKVDLRICKCYLTTFWSPPHLTLKPKPVTGTSSSTAANAWPISWSSVQSTNVAI